MKKKLTLLILLAPFVALAQTSIDKSGKITIDFGGKDKKPQQQEADTPKPEKFVYPSDEEEAEERKTAKQRRAENKKIKKEGQEDFDWKKDGLFKGLFSAGINAAQVDGDNQAGYNYLGFNGGVGVMIRYHRFLSTSIEIHYSMQGAKQKIVPNPNPLSRQMYQLQLDYIDIPVSLLNVHDKKLVMFSLGLTPQILVRYKERNEVGEDVTNLPNTIEPRRFNLSGFAGFGFVIKQQFYLGGQFNYSFISMRPALSGTRVTGQYNNVLTFRFMYIMSAIKKKK